MPINLTSFNTLRLAITACIISVAVSRIQAEDFYLAQTQQGLGNGANAANAAGVTFFNNVNNWSSPTKLASRIGPGDTVHLTGTITSALVFQRGGTASSGPGTGPITLYFEPGAVMTSPAWPNPNNATGAISVPHLLGVGLGFVIVDGGTNGLIKNTANGTLLANQVDSIGVAFEGSHDSIVRNLTVENLYVRPGPNNDANACGIGVKIFTYGETVPSYNDVVTNCTFHDEYEGVYILYGTGWTNMEYSFCTAYNCNWGGNAGDASSSASLSGLRVHDNNFHDFAIWDDNSGANTHHHNGFFGWAASGGNLTNVSYYNNTIGPNFGVHSTSGIYDSGSVSGILIYNNVFLENGPTDAPDDGLIYLLPNLGSGGPGFKVYNNTFLGGGVGTAIDFADGLGPSTTIFEAKNNVAENLGTFISVYNSGSSTLVSDYNVLYNLKSTLLATSTNNTARFDTLLQWRALGYDIHSTILTPNLNSSYIPQLPSSAVNNGTNLSTYFSVDMDGASRPSSGPWDMGALQHTAFVPVVTPVVTSTTTATATQNASFTYTISASNGPTSFEATSLPSGLSVNSSTGVISGKPTPTGTFAVTIGATNSAGTGTATLTLTVSAAASAPAPTISSALTAAGTVNQTFTYTITALNSPSAYSASGLPAGLSINTATGMISGKPTASGTFAVTIGATNSTGTGTATLTLTISVASFSSAPTISSALTAAGTVNQTFTYTITALNSPSAYSASGLPAGLSINTATGMISGKPTASGTFAVTIGATNSTGTGTATLTLTISAASSSSAPTISSALTAAGTVNQTFTYTITALNSPSGYSASGLPAGLSINTATGMISGKPTASGTFAVTIGATNSAGTGTATLTLNISAAVVSSAPVISGPFTATATLNQPFAYSIAALGSPTGYTATGLPSGLTIDKGTGDISGTPKALGTYSISLTATNSLGTGTATLTLTVVAYSIPVISSAGAETATVSVSFSYTIVASNSPTSYSATGLPTGLSLNSITGQITGKISGPPPTSMVVQLGATNPAGTGTKNLTITIAGLPGSSPTDLSTPAVAPIATNTARLINLSTRAVAGPGASSLITGFVVLGGSMPVLVRGIGPGLQIFGVIGVLPDPSLSLYNGSTLIDSNSGWGGDPTLATAFAEVHAFPLDNNSADSALLTTLSPSAYTAQLSSPAGSTGIALAEIYDADPNLETSSARLVNLSARASVGSGGNILIVGFAIGGSGTETVLIRAVGPTLANFGVTGCLSNPVLTILDSNQNVVATNSGWGGDPVLTNTFAQVGAFALPNDSADAALLLTLAPGAYSAQISGVNGSVGIALGEVYEIP